VTAELAHEALPVEVDVLADERRAMAVPAAVPAGDHRADAVPKERDLARTPRVMTEGHGLKAVRHGDRGSFRCNARAAVGS
jgi:hypothetical protein